MTIDSLTEPDVIRVASRSRPDVFHDVAVSVLAGQTTGCSCEAAQRGVLCWARKDVDANEAEWGFARCTATGCGVLCRLEQWNTQSGPIRIWICPRAREHSSHEAGVAVMYRLTRGTTS